MSPAEQIQLEAARAAHELTKVAYDSLKSQLERAQARIVELTQERDELDEDLDAAEAQIHALKANKTPCASCVRHG